MFSLYCLSALCGTLKQIIWVSELGGLFKFIDGNCGEEKRELEVILKTLFLPEAGACCGLWRKVINLYTPDLWAER